MTRRNGVLGAIALAALIGLVDAGYLAWTAAFNISPGCTFIHGCDIVAESPLSHFLGIPWGFYGVVFYFTVLALASWSMAAEDRLVVMLIRLAGVAGFVMSLYFTALEIWVIHAWCEFCLLSALVATTIFILTLFVVQSGHAQGGGHGTGLYAPGPGQ